MLEKRQMEKFNIIESRKHESFVCGREGERKSDGVVLTAKRQST